MVVERVDNDSDFWGHCDYLYYLCSEQEGSSLLNLMIENIVGHGAYLYVKVLAAVPKTLAMNAYLHMSGNEFSQSSNC